VVGVWVVLYFSTVSARIKSSFPISLFSATNLRMVVNTPSNLIKLSILERNKKKREKREKGEGRREKGKGRREKGEGMREKGKGKREKGKGKREKGKGKSRDNNEK
jgi:hypothetical protein